ncbi:unnamed protein product [Miscanthus lutarioriparius]|uniref:Uncharacterized protein n=1 Tax=Miscanthus lutarioriparius TaxID=422564 RepID=A0A811RX62_9POAL|nr:unnamed protein product [Miscanthus lutarioriparius]
MRMKGGEMSINPVRAGLLLPSPAEKNKISKNAGAGEIFFHQLLIQDHLSASIHELRPDDKAQLGSFAVLEINLDIRAVKMVVGFLKEKKTHSQLSMTGSCEKVVIDKDNVAKGLHELVTHYNIAKLVVGAAVDEYYSNLYNMGVTMLIQLVNYAIMIYPFPSAQSREHGTLGGIHAAYSSEAFSAVATECASLADELVFHDETRHAAWNQNGYAYGDQTMRFDRLLRVGECYDFMRVGFAPTHVGPLGYIFRLCADYFVVLSPQSMANAPSRELWIYRCPRAFMEFKDVYAQAEYFFVDVIGIVMHVSNIRGRDDVRMRPYRLCGADE